MPERLVKVDTRRITQGQISMWGTLHLSVDGGKLAGWLCDAWTEAGSSPSEVLLPRLYWLSKEDDKFHRVRLNIPVAGPGAVELGPVDLDVDPRRLRSGRKNTSPPRASNFFQTKPTWIESC